MIVAASDTITLPVGAVIGIALLLVGIGVVIGWLTGSYLTDDDDRSVDEHRRKLEALAPRDEPMHYRPRRDAG